MITDPWFYLAAVPAVTVVGLSKGGLGGGVSILAVPLMTLVISPVEAAAIMLPVLIAMDIVALIAWRGIWDRQSVVILIPSTIAGIAIGWAVAAYVSEAQVELMLGLIALAFTLDFVFRARRGRPAKPHDPVKGWFWGAVGGFTSFVSHAGGPPLQMYLLPLRLDPGVMAGTTVLVFAVANFVKLVPYAMLGQLSGPHLATSAMLLPLAPISTWLGARLVRVISFESFYRISYAALFVVGVKLTFDGAASLL